MVPALHIPEPVMFNPLKHYLPFIRDYITLRIPDSEIPCSYDIIRELKHIGNCVMDIYTGTLSVEKIYSEIIGFLEQNKVSEREQYKNWTGTKLNDYRIISLSDGSQWTLKYNDSASRYVHIFPARSSSFTFRIKANTLKSAVLYLVTIGKDYISDEDLNKARALAGLSPIKEVADAEAVTEMIEILRK